MLPMQLTYLYYVPTGHSSASNRGNSLLFLILVGRNRLYLFFYADNNLFIMAVAIHGCDV